MSIKVYGNCDFMTPVAKTTSLTEHTKYRFLKIWIPVIFASALPGSLSAQAPGVVVEEWVSQEKWAELLEKALDFKKNGDLAPEIRLKAELKNPVPGPINTLPARDEPLDPVLLAKRSREIRLWLMALYICPKCTHWHLRDLVAAYAVAPDVVATCEHAFSRYTEQNPQQLPKEAYLLVRDSRHRIFGITGIVAANAVMDAVLLRVNPPRLDPVPLNDQLSPGDRVFCYSDPLGQAGYFSDGILNRFFWLPNRRGAPDSLEQTSYLRVNFGTDWAPGSSGAPVLDQCGNVAGHVSSIQALARPQGDRKTDKSGSGENSPVESNFPLITVHEGIPARGILALIRDTNERARGNSLKPAVFPREPDLLPRSGESSLPAP